MSFSFGSAYDDLFDAEFRGVPFHMPQANEETGRRQVRFVFAGRDDTQHEDLGAFDGPITVTGLIIGDDYIRRARRMREAFREAGPGLLVHPWLGEIEVVLSQPADIAFDDTELRVARFKAIFEPWIEREASKLDSFGLLLDALDQLREGARRLIRLVLAPFRLVTRMISAVADLGAGIAGMFGGAITAARGMGALLGATASDRAALSTIGGLAPDDVFGGTVADRLAAPSATALAAGLPLRQPAIGAYAVGTDAVRVDAEPVARMLLMLADALAAAWPVGATAAGAPLGIEARITQLAIAARCLVLADATSLAVRVPFESRDAALDMRDALDMRWAALTRDAAMGAVADPATIGPVWRQMADARAAMLRDLSEKAGRLPSVQYLSLAIPASVWLVAQHLVGDEPGAVVPQVEDLVARNRLAPAGLAPAGTLEILR
jgi:hypothetical protein